jgi:hypothetical protein
LSEMKEATKEAVREEISQVGKDLMSLLVAVDKVLQVTEEIREKGEKLPARIGQEVDTRLRDYLRVFDMMLDDRDFTSAPGVVSLVPADRSPFNPMNWFAKRYLLTPYCESDTGVHPVEFKVPFKKPPAWWEKTAPGLAFGLKVLSAGLSIGCAGLPLAMGDKLYDSVKNDVAFMKELAKHLELKGGAPSDISASAGRFVVSLDPATRARDFREFPAEDQKRIARQQLAGLLQEIAPKNYKARQWGPLRRIRMPDNTYRWLCPAHAQRYR